jgi:hypothetical protein
MPAVMDQPIDIATRDLDVAQHGIIGSQFEI